MRKELAKVLLYSSRILAGIATLLDRQTVVDETTKALVQRFGHFDTIELDGPDIEPIAPKPGEWGGYL